MCRFFRCGLATVAALALLASSASALRIAVMPAASTKTKVLQADAVVVGKVTGIDKETVELEQFPGGPKVAHAVANVKIESSLFGAKNVTHLKIAYVPPGTQGQPGAARPVRPGFGGQPAYTPAEEHEGVFFLSKHPTSENHYQVQFNHNPVLSTDPRYKDEVATVKAMAVTFADPVKALSSGKDEERVANALSLAQRYRTAPQNNPSGVFEESPIPAEQTQLFLKVLTEVDWTKYVDAPRLADALGLMPGNYGIPRVAAADGEEPLAARQKAFKGWAEKYGAKYEVKKLSAKPAEQQPNSPVPPARGGVIRPAIDR
jgi:hypothetical protein